MFVSDWMTIRPFTISADDPIAHAAMLMKEKAIKHLPVLDEGRLKGVLADGDIKYFVASKCSETRGEPLKELMQSTRVREIMTSNVATIAPTAPVEEAARVMHDLRISCLPVVIDGRLAGIISRLDIYRSIVEITGVTHGGNRIYLVIEDRPGSIRDITDTVRKHGFRLQSILTSYEGVAEGYRKVVIRTKNAGDLKALRTGLQSKHGDLVIHEG